MAKYKIGPGQALRIGQYHISAISTGCRLVPLQVPCRIEVTRGESGAGDRRHQLAPRQCLVLPDGGRLLSDSRHAIELAVLGPEGEYVDPERLLRRPRNPM